MTGIPDGVDPARLALCLDVLAEVEKLPVEHPDAVAVRRATAGLFKTVKLTRRRERRDAVLAADRAVTESTATGAPGRIDDETAGIPLRSAATAASEPSAATIAAALGRRAGSSARPSITAAGSWLSR